MRGLAVPWIAGVLIVAAACGADSPDPARVSPASLAEAAGFPSSLTVERVHGTSDWNALGEVVWFLRVASPERMFPTTGIVLFRGPVFLTPERIEAFDAEIRKYDNYIAYAVEERRRRIRHIDEAAMRARSLQQLAVYRADLAREAVHRREELPDGRRLYVHRRPGLYRAELPSPCGVFELVVAVSSKKCEMMRAEENEDFMKTFSRDPLAVAHNVLVAVDAALFAARPGSDARDNAAASAAEPPP
jgi:hypothetical protein